MNTLQSMKITVNLNPKFFFVLIVSVSLSACDEHKEFKGSIPKTEHVKAVRQKDTLSTTDVSATSTQEQKSESTISGNVTFYSLPSTKERKEVEQNLIIEDNQNKSGVKTNQHGFTQEELKEIQKNTQLAVDSAKLDELNSHIDSLRPNYSPGNTEDKSTEAEQN